LENKTLKNIFFMDEKQRETFCREIADVCSKYKIQGLSGIYFEGDADNYGFIKCSDLTDFRMKHIVEEISKMLEMWSGDIHKGESLGSIRVMSNENKTKN
jgi:hypothetical protein